MVLREALRQLVMMDLPDNDPRMLPLQDLLGQVLLWERNGNAVAWLPPLPGKEEYRSFPDVLRSVFRDGQPLRETDRELLLAAQTAIRSGDAQDIHRWVSMLHAELPTKYSEKVSSEVNYYNTRFTRQKLDGLYHGIPGGGVVLGQAERRLATPRFVDLGNHRHVLLIAAITWRCILRGRPPVSTLYETLLFIGGCIAVLGIATEWIQRRLIAISSGVINGSILYFLSI